MAEMSLLRDLPSDKSNTTASAFTRAELDGMLCQAYGPLEAFLIVLRQLGDGGASPDARDVNAGAIAEVLDALQSHAYNAMLDEFSRLHGAQGVSHE